MLVDTHAHIHDPAFAGDGGVVERARAAGVTRIIDVGCDAETTRAAVAQAESHPGVWAAIGIHPHESRHYVADERLEAIRPFAPHPRVVAVGEIGLDYAKMHSTKEDQQLLFRRQLRFAREIGKPVVIHCRDAYEDLKRILREEMSGLPAGSPKSHVPSPTSDPPGPRGEGGRRLETRDLRLATPSRGVMHCFSGSVEDARDFLDMGFVLSIAGPVTFPNAEGLRRVAESVPIDRLVVETDCPYLTPVPHRGKRNEPAYVRHTAERIAALRGMSLEAFAEISTRTAMRVFGLPSVLSSVAPPSRGAKEEAPSPGAKEGLPS